MWFSEGEREIGEVKAVCASCPVREECASLGENEDFGVWGGMTPVERRAAKRFRLLVREEVLNARIRRMQADGLSNSAMARELGIPRKTLTDRLAKAAALAA